MLTQNLVDDPADPAHSADPADPVGSTHPRGGLAVVISLAAAVVLVVLVEAQTGFTSLP